MNDCGIGIVNRNYCVNVNGWMFYKSLLLCALVVSLVTVAA